MTTYIITYLDERDRLYTQSIEADTVEAAIEIIEASLEQSITVRKIEIEEKEDEL